MRHDRRAGLGLIGLLLGVSLAGAQTPPSPPPLGSGADLIELNRAIRAYAAEERAAADEIFTRLLETSRDPELRAACHYYLGLIDLEHGLEHAGAAQAATARQAADEAAAEATEARRHFQRAQGNFEEVIRLADPSAEIVSAALLLGIAQLAADYPGEEQPQALAERAAATLTHYIESDYGRNDRYGHFYLAVANYRLSDYYRDAAGRGPAFRNAVDRAMTGFARAAELAAEDAAADRLAPESYEAFRTVLTYYDGLLAIMSRNNARARELFSEVQQRAEGTELARNAGTIVQKLDEAEQSSPPPIQIPVPAPIGPIEIEGRLRLGHSYDTNVILLGKETALPRGYKREDDYRFTLRADIDVSRYISKSEAPWVGESLTLGVGAGTQNGWQPNIQQFDVNRYPGRAWVNWQPIRDFYLGLQYEYSYTLLGQDPFISSHRITPVISKVWRCDDSGNAPELGRTDLYYTFDQRNYFDRLTDRRTNRDGEYQALGIQQRLNLVRAADLPYMRSYFLEHERENALFGNDWLYVYAGYEYRDEQTRGTEFDLRGNSFVWGASVPLPYRLAFTFDGEFTWADYTGASLFDFNRKERNDFMQRYDFGLVYSIIRRGENVSMRTLDMRLRGGVELTFQNSNIWNRFGEDIYEYNRAIYGVTLEVDF